MTSGLPSAGSIGLRANRSRSPRCLCSAPDQVKGLVHLLSLGLRILTLIEFVVRRQLKVKGESLVGLHPENPQQETSRPTTERLLKAFDNLTLTILEVRGQQYGHASPLNSLQEQILRLLGLSSEIYSGLVEESSG